MKGTTKTKNKVAKLFVAIIVFCVASLFTIDVPAISQNAFGAEVIGALDGINGAKLGEKQPYLQDSTFLNSQNINKNQYYSLNHISTNVFKGMNKIPSNIYVGFFYEQMQSIQYIYNEDIQVFEELDSYLEEEFKSSGKLVKDPSKPLETAKIWCNAKPNKYIVLYKIQTETSNKTVLAVADKKLINEELNLDTQAGLPTGICYRYNLKS